jgi:hypothetical protein
LKAPRELQTARLTLAAPRPVDADAMFERYASDPGVTRYLGWPRHQSIAETQRFVAFSSAAWQRWPLVRATGRSHDWLRFGEGRVEERLCHRGASGHGRCVALNRSGTNLRALPLAASRFSAGPREVPLRARRELVPASAVPESCPRSTPRCGSLRTDFREK